MRRPALVYLIFVLSGAAGLIYEVVWARQLVLVFGNTTQAISAILTGYFGGMALGSVIGGRLAHRIRAPPRVYAAPPPAPVRVGLPTPRALLGVPEGYPGAVPRPGGGPT